MIKNVTSISRYTKCNKNKTFYNRREDVVKVVVVEEWTLTQVLSD